MSRCVGVVCVEILWYGVCRVRPDTLVTCARYSCSVRVAWLGVAVDGRRRIKAQHLDHDGSSARAACLCAHGPAPVSVAMLHDCDQALAGSTSLLVCICTTRCRVVLPPEGEEERGRKGEGGTQEQERTSILCYDVAKRRLMQELRNLILTFR